MFGRTEKSDSAPAPVEDAAPDKKGRPTPTRKDAQAAAKARATAGTDKKGAQQVLKSNRAESNKRMREGMKNGEEKYLPARDQGPVKRATRDWVDSHLMFTEFVLPILVLILLTSSAPKGSFLQHAGVYLQSATMILLVVDIVSVRFRLKKALRAQFPEDPLKGVTFYAITRMLQLRFMRLPKPKVKIGGKPV